MPASPKRPTSTRICTAAGVRRTTVMTILSLRASAAELKLVGVFFLAEWLKLQLRRSTAGGGDGVVNRDALMRFDFALFPKAGKPLTVVAGHVGGNWGRGEGACAECRGEGCEREKFCGTNVRLCEGEHECPLPKDCFRGIVSARGKVESRDKWRRTNRRR